MAKIYGAESRYLRNQGNSFTIKNYSFLGLAILLWAIALVILFYGLFIHQSLLLKWLLPLFAISGTISMWLASTYQGKTFNYRDGQTGEQEVLNELKKLPDNYAVFCDLLFPGKKGNIDYVVSGHKGFIAIEVKNWNHPRFNSHLDGAVSQTMGNTLALQKYLSTLTKEKIFVQGVLVFSRNDRGVQTSTRDRIVIIHKNNINKYITSKQSAPYQSEIIRLEHRLMQFIGHNLI